MPSDNSPPQNSSEKPDQTWPATPKAQSNEPTRPSRPDKFRQTLQARQAQTSDDSKVKTAETKRIKKESKTPSDQEVREAKLIPAIHEQSPRLNDDGNLQLMDDDQPTQPVVSAKILSKPESSPLTRGTHEPPWTLQQFFNGEIDLDVELARRFPNMPMMARIKFRTLGVKSGRRVATLESQDGSASVILDADPASKVVQMSFTFGSMITLRFNLLDLTDMDRKRWLELMRRQQGGLAFLWGPTRWMQDYMICITRKYHSNLYAFSPNNFEAAVRMTNDVTTQLIDWLEEFWAETQPPDDDPPQLLTW